MCGYSAGERGSLVSSAVSSTRRFQHMLTRRSQKVVGQDLIIQCSCQDHGPTAERDEQDGLLACCRSPSNLP